MNKLLVYQEAPSSLGRCIPALGETAQIAEVLGAWCLLSEPAFFQSGHVLSNHWVKRHFPC